MKDLQATLMKATGQHRYYAIYDDTNGISSGKIGHVIQRDVYWWACFNPSFDEVPVEPTWIQAVLNMLQASDGERWAT